MDMDERRCRAASTTIPPPKAHGTVVVEGLAAGVWYEDLSIVACASVGASTCADFNELECAAPAAVDRFVTASRTQMGGGWCVL